MCAFVKIAHSVPHLCARRESVSLPRHGSGRRAALAAVSRTPFGAGKTATRCFSPTSATNVRSMHPRSVRFPSVGLSPPPTDPARCDPPCGESRLRTAGAELHLHPALTRSLAVAVQMHRRKQVRPQVDARLTTPIELRARCSRSPLFREETRTAPGGAPVPRRCRPRVRLSCEHLCHPLSRRVPGEPDHRHQDPLTHPPVKGEWADTAQDDFNRRVPAPTAARAVARAENPRNHSLTVVVREVPQ
jgi:hypothetical protein